MTIINYDYGIAGIMGFVQLLKERESLTVRSEDYKKSVRQYMESKGYRVDQESGIEGGFEDFIFLARENSKVCVECKDSKVGLYSREFILPFLTYFAKYITLPPENRFRVAFFFSKVSDTDAFNSVFRLLDTKEISKFSEKCKDIYNIFVQEIRGRSLVDLSTVQEEDIKAFINDCDVYVAEVSMLERAVRIRQREVTERPLFATLADIADIQKAHRELADPETLNEKLWSNLFSVLEIPSFIWRVPLVCIKSQYIPEKGEKFPFITKEGFICTFFEPTDLLRERLPNGGSVDIENIPTQEWLTSDLRRHWLIELLNNAFTCHCKALKFGQEERTGRFCLFSRGQKEIHATWWPGGIKKSRYMAKPFYDVAGQLNYWAHRAITGRFTYIGGDLYLQLSPTWVFTENGIKPLSTSRVKALFHVWRKKERNANQMRDLLFWIDYLAKHSEVFEIATRGDKIKIAVEPLATEVSWGIKSDIPARGMLLQGEPSPEEEVEECEEEIWEDTDEEGDLE